MEMKENKILKKSALYPAGLLSQGLSFSALRMGCAGQRVCALHQCPASVCVCVCVCVCISEGGFQSGGGTNRELGDFGKITKKGVRMSEG